MFSKRKEECKNLEKLHYRFKIYDVILLYGYTVVEVRFMGCEKSSRKCNEKKSKKLVYFTHPIGMGNF